MVFKTAFSRLASESNGTFNSRNPIKTSILWYMCTKRKFNSHRGAVHGIKIPSKSGTRHYIRLPDDKRTSKHLMHSSSYCCFGRIRLGDRSKGAASSYGSGERRLPAGRSFCAPVAQQRWKSGRAFSTDRIGGMTSTSACVRRLTDIGYLGGDHLRHIIYTLDGWTIYPRDCPVTSGDELARTRKIADRKIPTEVWSGYSARHA